MFTISSLLIALFVVTAFLAGMFGPKIIRKVRTDREERMHRKEVEEGLALTKDGRFLSSDGMVEARMKDHHIEWIRLVGGEKRESIEELLMRDSMPMTTYEEILELKEDMNDVQKLAQEEMYHPSYFTKIQTSDELGEDLYIYRHGKIRLTNRLIVTVGEGSTGNVEVLGAYISSNNLERTQSLYELDFVTTAMNPLVKVHKAEDIFDSFLQRPDFKEEKEIMNQMDKRLEFYNRCITEGSVYLSGGRAYIKDMEPKHPVAAEPKKEEASAPTLSIEDVVKEAMDARSSRSVS